MILFKSTMIFKKNKIKKAPWLGLPCMQSLLWALALCHGPVVQESAILHQHGEQGSLRGPASSSESQLRGKWIPYPSPLAFLHLSDFVVITGAYQGSSQETSTSTERAEVHRKKGNVKKGVKMQHFFPDLGRKSGPAVPDRYCVVSITDFPLFLFSHWISLLLPDSISIWLSLPITLHSFHSLCLHFFFFYLPSLLSGLPMRPLCAKMQCCIVGAEVCMCWRMC